MKSLFPAALVLVMLLPGAALGQQQDAMTVVRTHVQAVLDVLRNPALKGEKGEKEKKERIKAEAEKLFDFVELSKRTLGLNWNRLTVEQRKEFVSLYKDLLEETYIERITAYTNEKVRYAKAIPLDGNTVEVRTEVATQTGVVPIDYRVINENGEWKVYDVVIEGVSLITNYRSQFREILASKPPEALLDTLRKRVGAGPQ